MISNKLTRPEQSRINGSKSCGPTTPTGKATSSRNSLKHGYAAEVNILIEPDDSDAWHTHIAGYRDSYLPTNYAENEFVEKLASISWRHSRLVNVETALTALELAIQKDEVNENFPLEQDNPNLHLALAWHGLSRKQQPASTEDESLNICSIELVRRYQTSLDRQFRNTLLSFRQYRKDFAPPQAQQIQQPEPPQLAEQNEPEASIPPQPKMTIHIAKPASRPAPEPKTPPHHPENKAA